MPLPVGTMPPEAGLTELAKAETATSNPAADATAALRDLLLIADLLQEIYVPSTVAGSRKFPSDLREPGDGG
jgi:hypothetical protein